VCSFNAMARFVSALGISLALAGPAAVAMPLKGQPERPWTLWLQGGVHFSPLYDNALADQMLASGHEFIGIGPQLGLGLQRYVLEWLAIGGSIDARWMSGGRVRGGVRQRGQRGPVDMAFGRVAGMVFVQPTLHLCWGYEEAPCLRDGGYAFGLQVGLGGGGSWWSLGGETELGAHFRMEAAFVWELHSGPFVLGLRIVNGGTLQSGFGPEGLGHGLAYTAGADMRIGGRW